MRQDMRLATNQIMGNVLIVEPDKAAFAQLRDLLQTCFRLNVIHCANVHQAKQKLKQKESSVKILISSGHYRGDDDDQLHQLTEYIKESQLLIGHIFIGSIPRNEILIGETKALFLDRNELIRQIQSFL